MGLTYINFVLKVALYGSCTVHASYADVRSVMWMMRRMRCTMSGDVILLLQTEGLNDHHKRLGFSTTPRAAILCTFCLAWRAPRKRLKKRSDANAYTAA